jgi:predicted ATPase
MTIERNNFYIISGGPGSGKSSIIEALKDHGFLTVDEVGRQIIQEQIRIDGDALHWKDQIKFRDLMLSRSIYTFEQVTEKKRPVFFDRGIPELIGYCHLIKTNVPNYLRNATQLFRYNQKVFVTPPWEEIYQNDPERRQTWQEAIDTYHNVIDSYDESGYQLVEIPKVTLTERVDFILRYIDKDEESLMHPSSSS